MQKIQRTNDNKRGRHAIRKRSLQLDKVTDRPTDISGIGPYYIISEYLIFINFVRRGERDNTFI